MATANATAAAAAASVTPSMKALPQSLENEAPLSFCRCLQRRCR